MSKTLLGKAPAAKEDSSRREPHVCLGKIHAVRRGAKGRYTLEYLKDEQGISHSECPIFQVRIASFRWNTRFHHYDYYSKAANYDIPVLSALDPKQCWATCDRGDNRRPLDDTMPFTPSEPGAPEPLPAVAEASEDPVSDQLTEREKSPVRPPDPGPSQPRPSLWTDHISSPPDPPPQTAWFRKNFGDPRKPLEDYRIDDVPGFGFVRWIPKPGLPLDADFTEEALKHVTSRALAEGWKQAEGKEDDPFVDMRTTVVPSFTEVKKTKQESAPPEGAHDSVVVIHTEPKRETAPPEEYIPFMPRPPSPSGSSGGGASDAGSSNSGSSASRRRPSRRPRKPSKTPVRGGPGRPGGGPGGGGPGGGGPGGGGQPLAGPNPRSTFKFPMPDPFLGKPDEASGASNAREFISKVELTFRWHQWEFFLATTRVEFVLFLCQGAAFSWASAYIEALGDPRNPLHPRTLSWTRFKKAFLAQFSSIDQAQTATRLITTLKQTGKVSEYAAKFREYAAQTKWNDDSKIAVYHTGLRDTIKTIIATSVDIPGRYEDYVNWTIKIGDRLDQAAAEHARSAQSSGRNAQTGRNQTSTSNSRNRGRPNTGNDRPRSSLSREETERYRREGLCFKCGKKGHNSNDPKFHPRPTGAGGSGTAGGAAGVSTKTGNATFGSGNPIVEEEDALELDATSFVPGKVLPWHEYEDVIQSSEFYRSKN